MHDDQEVKAAVSSSAHLVLRIVKFDSVGQTISYFNVCIALLFMRRTRCADDDTAASNGHIPSTTLYGWIIKSDNR